MTNQTRVDKIKNKTIFISCIVPVFNEEKNIQLFINELQACLMKITTHYEIILVDDGSTDHSVKKILSFPNKENLKLIAFSRNFGKEIAISAGIEHAKGEVAILLDADFQHPINMIPTFLEAWSNDFDMIYGERKSRQGETYIKRKLAKMFYWLMKKISHVDIPNNAGDFRLLDQKIIAAFKQFPERIRFMKGLYAWVGYKKLGIPYEVNQRKAGVSSWGFIKLIELAITGITSFSDVPLRIWSFVGFVISFFSFLYALYIFGITLIYGADWPGFPTLIVAIMFFGGIQLLSIGILGEYIARIFTEVKQRPRYLIAFKEGFQDNDC